MIRKYFALAMVGCFLLVGCDKKKDHDHDHKGHDHEHKGHDHAHKGHDHAHQDHKELKAKDHAEEVKDPKAAQAQKTVEAGCAMCIYKMEGVKKCELAVKIDGKPYLVEGTAMLDHGNAHAEGGMCKVARQAAVEGKIEGDKFKATKFELKPLAK